MDVLKKLMVSSGIRVGDSFGLDENDFVTHINAEFFSPYKNLDEFDKEHSGPHDGEHLVAKISCIFLNIDDLDWNIHDFLDTDGDLYDLYAPLFRDSKRHCLSDSITEKLDLYTSNNIFYIAKLEVPEPFRGKRIGGEVIRYMVKKFALDANIAILKPHPLEKDLPEKERKSKQKRLQKYYKSMGFQPTKNDKEWYFLDLS